MTVRLINGWERDRNPVLRPELSPVFRHTDSFRELNSSERIALQTQGRWRQAANGQSLFKRMSAAACGRITYGKFVRHRFTARKAELVLEKGVTHDALLQELRANRSLDRVYGGTPLGHSNEWRVDAHIDKSTHRSRAVRKARVHDGKKANHVGSSVQGEVEVAVHTAWRTGSGSLGRRGKHYKERNVCTVVTMDPRECTDLDVYVWENKRLANASRPTRAELPREQDVYNRGNAMFVLLQSIPESAALHRVQLTQTDTSDEDVLKELRGIQRRKFDVDVAGHNRRSNAALLVVELDEETAPDVLFGGTATGNAPCWW
ncbi:hypothetical protein BDW22DRAFT_1345909 [Trametopsis cervina]|nr:hypothetical protein BDW22DRAFT_1345909 [Trametopsis cervina]